LILGAFGRAADNFVLAVAALISASGVVIPLALVAWLVFVTWKRFRKRGTAAEQTGQS
jgi:hypothetical protein